MFGGPMTFLVVLGIGVCLAAGLAILVRSAGRSESPPEPRTCRRCRHENIAQAKYCANCGLKLD
jgi:hypothetical protein